MMKPTYTIAIAAIFMVAAFAGIAMVDDEADAAEAPVTSVAYKIGTGSDSFETFTFEVSGESFIVKDITDFDVEVKGIFEKWTAGSVSYEPGATVTLSGLVAEGGVLTLTASVTGADVVSFIADGKVIEGGSLTPEAEKVTAPAVPEKEGFNAIGWKWSEDDKTYTAEEVNELTVAVGQTFTAVYEEIYEVYWSVDGTVTASGDVEAINAPQAPTKENYTFEGWMVDGELVIRYNADLVKPEGTEFADKGYIWVDGKEYEFTKDTTFVASFKPVQLTVTFMAGEQEVGKQTPNYGAAIMKPELPEGYVAWAADAEGTASFDFTAPATANVTVYAVAEVPSDAYEVTFVVDGEVIATYADNSITLPEAPAKEGFKFVGWTINNEVIADPVNYEFTKDTAFIALFQVAEPPAPEEPAFYETSTGQIVIVVVIFLILALGYGVYSNAFGLKDKLFGYTIQKKEKKE